DGVPAIFAGAINDTSRWISPEAARGKIVVLDFPAGVSIRGAPISAARWPGAAAIAPIALAQMSPEQMARLVEGRPVVNGTLNATATPVIYLSRRAASVLLGGDPASL